MVKGKRKEKANEKENNKKGRGGNKSMIIGYGW